PLDRCPPAAAPDPAGKAAWGEVRRVIDEEGGRLPEKYRAPFVLYHLEGRSSAEVAAGLGCPVATVDSRLARARARRRGRLGRRGRGYAPALLAGLVTPRWSPWRAGAVSATLAAGRGGARNRAAALADEVVRALRASRVGAAVVVLALAVAGSVGLAA